MRNQTRSGGFTLVELVIVTVIIATLGGIAVARVGRGARGAAQAALCADLLMLRSVIELYAAEHGGAFPSISPAKRFVDQLTTYSDASGNTNLTRTSVFRFGPYINAIPPLPIGEGLDNGKGRNKVGKNAASSIGWVYDETTGTIRANSGTVADKNGKRYRDY